MWRQWTLPLWSLGVLVFALRLVLSCRHVAALRRLGNAADGQSAQTVALLARRMKATRPIRVLISTVAESPSVVGWLRPVILLPAATLAGLEPEQLEAVLAHEIAHIRRHDYLVNLAQTMVETLLFYHPAVWWASARIRHERELCCDDAAVAACGDAIAYARALTRLERLRGTVPQLALGSTGGSLLYRIQRLAGVTQDIGPSKLPGIAALALGLACFAMTAHWAKAQQTMQQQPMPEEWGITVSSTGQVMRRDRVPYPEATYKDGVQGTVTMEATLDQSGNVADAHVLGGPPELRKTALQSVLQWQFANGRAGETQQVSIAFQQDARAKTAPQRHQDQFRVTEPFLQDELRGAEERGDSQAMQEIREKVLKAQLSQMSQQLAEAHKTLDERNPEMATLSAQIDALNEQITKFKQVNQGRLPSRDEADQTSRLLESQYASLTEALAQARQSLGDRSYQVKSLMAQVGEVQKRMETASASFQTSRLLESQYASLTEALAQARQSLGDRSYQVKSLMAQVGEVQKRMETASASLVGSRLARIEVNGVPDSARDGLATRITITLGEVLSQESMDRVVATVHQFDPRLECRFQRDGNRGVELRIDAPAPPK